MLPRPDRSVKTHLHSWVFVHLFDRNKTQRHARNMVALSFRPRLPHFTNNAIPAGRLKRTPCLGRGALQSDRTLFNASAESAYFNP